MIDLDKEVDRERERTERVKEDSTATATPRQPQRKAVSVADVLGLNAELSADDTEPESEVENEATPRHRDDSQPSASTSSSVSPVSLSPVSPLPPTTYDEAGRSAPESSLPTRTSTSGGGGGGGGGSALSSGKATTPRRLTRKPLSRVSEVESDPMAGDWGVPSYGKSLSPVINGTGGYDSGEVNFRFTVFSVCFSPFPYHAGNGKLRLTCSGHLAGRGLQGLPRRRRREEGIGMREILIVVSFF